MPLSSDIEGKGTRKFRKTIRDFTFTDQGGNARHPVKEVSEIYEFLKADIKKESRKNVHEGSLPAQTFEPMLDFRATHGQNMGLDSLNNREAKVTELISAAFFPQLPQWK